MFIVDFRVLEDIHYSYIIFVLLFSLLGLSKDYGVDLLS